MFKKLSLVCLVILGVSINIQAQQKIKLESLVPPAPNAAELGKYGTYPVGTLTGIPEIGFPLYEINTGKLKLPISLSYHAAGNQVSQKSTDVGLGWSVMAGGTISRTVYGTADNNPNGYFNYTPPSYSTLLGTTNYYTMLFYSNPGYDLEPDLFVYNLGGKSGKFICDINKNFKTIPFDPIKIQKTTTNGTNFVFQVVDDNGTIYKFDQYSNTTSDFGVLKNTINTWNLTSMISADLTDTINFIYEAVYIEDPMEQHSYPIGVKMKFVSPSMPYFSTGSEPSGLVIKTQSLNTYNELLLKQIKFKGGYVNFNRNTVRKDVSNYSKSLDEIVVFNSSSQTIKKITLNHSNYIASNFVDDWGHYRLKLSGFIESDSAKLIKKEHKFDYDGTSLPPYGSYSMDYWGYSNGASNTSDLIPTTTVYAGDINSFTSADGSSYSNNMPAGSTDSWTIGSAYREPSATYMKAGILTKITYPTGGYSNFEFEPHQYLSSEYNQQLISTGPATAYGIDKFTLRQTSVGFSFPSIPALAVVNGSQVVANLSINFSASNMGNTEIGETQLVTLTNTITNQIIKTWKHTGDLMVPLNINEKILLSKGGSYALKNEVYGNSAVSLMSSIYWYENTDVHPVKIGGGLRIKSIKNYSSDNVLAKEENYAYGVGENGLGVKLFEEKNFYKNYEDVVSAYYAPVDGPDGLGICVNVGNRWQRTFLGISKYNCINYMGSPILYSSVTKYEGNATSNIGKTVTNYNVISDPLSPPAEFINSGNYGAINSAWNYGELKDETIYKQTAGQYLPVSKSVYEYTNYNQTTETGIQVRQYKQFVQLAACSTFPQGPDIGSTKMGEGFFSIYSYPIKTGASRRTKETRIIYDQQNGSLSSSIETSTAYQNLSNLYPTQQSISTSDGVNNTKITRLKYPQDMTDAVSLAMVSKNILTPSLEEKLFKSVTGIETETLLSTMQTSYKQIGNLIIRDNIKASTYDAIPETRILFNQYDSYGNLLEQQKVNDVKEVYLWGYNSMYPVAKILNSTYDIAKTYITQSILNNPADDATLRNDLAHLRAIRNAIVTIFTYKPLVGVTSQTDPNGRITYYEYDAFNRLQLVKDQDGKILKKICYNYAGQQEDCSVNVTPVWTATGNLRCATSGGVNTGYQEREEKDSNPNSSTYNQNQWVSNGYNATACPVPVSCSFTIGSGFGLATSSISSSAGIASFYIVFYPTSTTMNPGNSYLVATINGGCRPSTTRTVSYSSGGRNWVITIYSNGQMYWYLSPGSTSVSTGTTIGTSTLTYNL
jgi:YD repeat-containing protein